MSSIAMLLFASAGCQRKDSSADSKQEVQVKAAVGNEAPQDDQHVAEPEDPGAPPVAKGAKLPVPEVLKVVNPKRQLPHEGPTGSVEGRIVAVGDPPMKVEQILMKIPGSCAAAREMFGETPREGANRSLADALVAVTGYSGYVPALTDSVRVEAQGCAWHARTVAMTYGQRLDVVSRDQDTYVPELVGHPWPVQLVAVPGGEPVFISPQKPGHFLLVDSMKLFNAAELYVLPYSTFAVTGLEGKYRIERIPPGTVKVNALLPATGATAEKEVTVRAGETVTVDLELTFERSVYEQRLVAQRERELRNPAEKRQSPQ